MWYPLARWQPGFHGNAFAATLAWMRSPPWCRRPIRVVSSLPPDVALQRLREDMVGDLAFTRREFAAAFLFEMMFRPWRRVRRGDRVVVGRVAGQTVAAAAQRVGLPHSWAPHLRGRIAAGADGCELAGTLGWARQTTVVMGILLGVLLAAAVNGLISGQGDAVAVPLAFLAFLLALTLIGDRLGRADEVWFREWLAVRLEGRGEEIGGPPA